MENPTFTELDKMSTKRLFNLLKYARSVNFNSYEDYGNTDKGQKKLDEEYEKDLEFYNNLKLILSEREHLPRKKQSEKGKTKTKEESLLLYELKKITKKLKLPKEHPDVIEAFRKRFEELKDSPHNYVGTVWCSSYKSFLAKKFK